MFFPSIFKFNSLLNNNHIKESDLNKVFYYPLMNDSKHNKLFQTFTYWKHKC